MERSTRSPAPGNYSTVYLIGAATTTGQINQPFILNYADTDGAVTDLVSMSSWAASAGYAGESVVASTPTKTPRLAASVAGTFDLYGYQIPADPTRTLVSVTLPSTRNVVIMALGFGTNTQVVVPGTYAYTPPSGTVLPVGTGSAVGNVHSKQHVRLYGRDGDQLDIRDQGDAHHHLANAGSDPGWDGAEQHAA